MSIISKTESGIEVELTGDPTPKQWPQVFVSLMHPKLGEIKFVAESYGKVNGKNGIIGHFKKGRVCVTVPKGDYEAAWAESKNGAEAAIGQEIANVKSGKTGISLNYWDGEYLSGYRANGHAGDLLVELGLASYVEGWGVHVKDDVAKALGTPFTYSRAENFARPALEAKRAAIETKRKAKEEKEAAAFALAKLTGEPVVLHRWTEECCERDFECDVDSMTECAMPDGSRSISRVHNH
jgi:hypothetical protein